MKRTIFVCTLIGMGAASAAETLPVTANAVFTFNGEEIVISRASSVDPAAVAAPTCQSPCLTPITAAAGVATFGELEVIEFLSTAVETGDGLLVDARLPETRAAGYIPASVNIPAATLAPGNPFRNEILLALGAVEFQGILNFADARRLVIFDGGPATQDAAALISDLLEAGYPAEKLSYYRGGAQVWALLGLSTERAVR